MFSIVRSEWFKTGVCILALLVAALIFAAGCTTNAVAPTQGENQSKLNWLNTFLAPGSGAQKAELPWDLVQCDTTVSAQIDADGGRIEMRRGDDKIEFEFEKNSVQNPTEIVVRCVKFDAPFGPFWMFDCGPDGTVFQVPIHVKVNGDFGREYTVLFYFSEETQQWEYEQVLTPGVTNDGDFDIHHFSKYGISE